MAASPDCRPAGYGNINGITIIEIHDVFPAQAVAPAARTRPEFSARMKINPSTEEGIAMTLANRTDVSTSRGSKALARNRALARAVDSSFEPLESGRLYSVTAVAA